MILYHYTCQYAAERIKAEGRIIPRRQAVLDGMAVVWLGDFRQRCLNMRERLGVDWHELSMRPCADQTPPCNPIAVRFGVLVTVPDHPHIRPFSQLAKEHPLAAAGYRMLPGAMVWRWWYSTVPIRLPGGIKSNVGA